MKLVLELLLPAEIVGSPAESHRQEAITGDHARGLRGGPAKQCTLQATCAAHGLKVIGYRYHAGRKTPRKRRARIGWQHLELNTETLNGRDLHLGFKFRSI